MDVIRLYQDFDIDYLTEGNRHCRQGWVQVHCPFCDGSKDYHLGWNFNDEYFTCYRCGWHPPVTTLSALMNMSYAQTIEIIKQYGSYTNTSFIKYGETNKKPFKLPSRTINLLKSHKAYLKKRGFNPKKIEKIWGVKSTTPVSMLAGMNYRFRIVIPYFWNGQIVSFDSRDVTNKQQNKYQACPIEFEAVEHKKILYGLQEHWNPKIGICVEGTTDVWKLGTLSFATSGIKFTNEQVRIIANTFENVAVVFDEEPQAIRQAKKLIAELKFRGVNAWYEPIKQDPGSMSYHKAKQFVKYIKSKV